MMETFIWTREEAYAAWKANRTTHNYALILPTHIKSIESVSGGFLVDGKPAHVEVCITEEVKNRLLSRREMAREEERPEREKWVKLPRPRPLKEKCICGGQLVLTHSYDWDRRTDVISDEKVVKCVDCGRVSVQNDDCAHKPYSEVSHIALLS